MCHEWDQQNEKPGQRLASVGKQVEMHEQEIHAKDEEWVRQAETVVIQLRCSVANGHQHCQREKYGLHEPNVR